MLVNDRLDRPVDLVPLLNLLLSDLDPTTHRVRAALQGTTRRLEIRCAELAISDQAASPFETSTSTSGRG